MTGPARPAWRQSGHRCCGDGRDVETIGDFQLVPRIGVPPTIRLGGTQLRDTARQLQLGRRVSKDGLAQDERLDRPASGLMPVSTNSTGSFAVLAAMNALTPPT